MSAHEEIVTAGAGQSSVPAASPLTPQAYDDAERTARKELSNRIVEAFQPVTFGGFGYPVRVDDIEELWKYVDVMQERRFEHDFLHLLGGLTEHERVDIFVARVAEKPVPVPNPAEVMAVDWVPMAALAAQTRERPEIFTPWLRIYLSEHAGQIFA